MKLRTWTSLAAAAVLLVAVGIVVACPNCKVNIEDTTNAQMQAAGKGNIGAAYFYSIIFMLSVPFTLATCLIVAIRRHAQTVP